METKILLLCKAYSVKYYRIIRTKNQDIISDSKMYVRYISFVLEARGMNEILNSFLKDIKKINI